MGGSVRKETVGSFRVYHDFRPPDMLSPAAPDAIVSIADGNGTDITSQLTDSDVHAHCLRRLPNYKIPSKVEFLARLPKTANGKVDKPKLVLTSPKNNVIDGS